MNESMKKLTGKTIVSVEGNKYKLGKISGYGSQGVVYEDETGSEMIKLYYPVDSDVINADKIVLYAADDDLQKEAFDNLTASCKVSGDFKQLFTEDMWTTYEVR